MAIDLHPKYQKLMSLAHQLNPQIQMMNIVVKHHKSWVQFDDAELIDHLKSVFPDMFVIDKFDQWEDKYHWTADFALNTMLPLILDYFKIDYDMSKFKKTECPDGDIGIPWQTYGDGAQLQFIDFENGSMKCGGAECLRFKPSSSNWIYRSMYAGNGRVSEVINKSLHSGRRLIVDADSMSISLMPLLAFFFDSILALDNRGKRSFKWLYTGFKPTHWLNIGLSLSYVNGKDVGSKSTYHYTDKIFNNNLR